jgi:FkbH-like protein
MKLTEALQHLNGAKAADLPVSRVVLACSFTPLHLGTLLGGHLQVALPARRIVVETPVFGDTPANLRSPAVDGAELVLVALEWTDLDPRLGFRHLGGWKSPDLDAIVDASTIALGRLREAVESAAAMRPIAVSLPGLRLPPAFLPPGAQASGHALALRERLARFASECASIRNVKVLDAEALDASSPIAARYDVRSDLATGFPYSMAHASALAAQATACLAPRPPMKGLITDLDDTVWKGLVGEVGSYGVRWDLDGKGQIHGLYQQLLESLADSGVLLAAASKNDADVVATVWQQRTDVVLRRESVFPWEVHWRPKSESVAAILARWNIGADSVVFVDDSPHELAEVKAAFPEMECILFPKAAPQDAFAMFYRLRELFGKHAVLDEDRLRLNSIRNAAELAERSASSSVSDQSEFLRGLHGVVRFTIDPPPQEERTLQLVNKTNQFNLNGLRRTQSEWDAMRAADGAFVMSIAYEDRLGPLGTIGVIQGAKTGGRVTVDTWVLSCRAFSRLIEHQTLAFLFDELGADEVAFAYAPTPKNALTGSFLADFVGPVAAGDVVLPRATFDAKRPTIDQEVKVLRGSDTDGNSDRGSATDDG